MNLTEKEMDDINILLTDVSLELLGNRFFDIHGQQSNNLSELCTNIQKPNHLSSACDFFEYLGPTKSLSLTHKVNALTPQLKKNQQPKSNIQSNSTVSTMMDNGAIVENGDNKISSEPSLRTKRIKRQRNTTKLYRQSKPAVIPEENQSSGNVFASTSSNSTSNILSFEDEMKKNIAVQYDQMRRESQHLRMHHFHERKTDRRKRDKFGLPDIPKLIQEYHIEELEQLKCDSIALIEFIKFIKSQPDNVKKMDEISANILLITDRV